MTHLTDDTIMKVFNENWNHIRHTERERGLCLQIYAAIFVGSLYALTTEAAQSLFFYIAGFLLFFTVINLLIALKEEAVISNHAQGNIRIVNKLKIKNYAPIRTRQPQVWNIIRHQWLFPSFYVLSLAGIIILIIIHPI